MFFCNSRNLLLLFFIFSKENYLLFWRMLMSGKIYFVQIQFQLIGRNSICTKLIVINCSQYDKQNIIISIFHFICIKFSRFSSTMVCLFHRIAFHYYLICIKHELLDFNYDTLEIYRVLIKVFSSLRFVN